MEGPKVGSVYQHLKGTKYRVIALAVHSETQEVHVVYKSRREERVWVRPLEHWQRPTADGLVRFKLVRKAK